MSPQHIIIVFFIAACLTPAALILAEVIGVMRDQTRDEFYD